MEEILRALYDEGVAFVIVGGAAMQLQGSGYVTLDLDFCYERSRDNIQKLSRALAPYHPALRDAPEGLPFRFDCATIEHRLNFTLSTDLGPLDFLGEVLGIGDYAAVKAVSEIMELYGLNHRVLSLDGLIMAKRAAGRDKDIAALKELEAIKDYRNRTGL
jgi:predicted nucleotidyltransferase